MTKLNDMVGGKVAQVELIGREEAYITLFDGRVFSLMLFGDCCSHSYFTDEALKELEGSTILKVEERSGPSQDSYEESYDVTWSFLVFKTNRGHITVDWRNDSNGYYSGWLEVKLTTYPTKN